MKNLVGIAVALAVAACAGTSWCSTISVPADQPTIQDGIDAAATGDTVLVSPGIYTENINFGGKTIVVISQAGAKSTRLEPANSSAATVTFATGEGPETEFGGFTVAGGTGACMIYLNNGALPVIHDNIIRDFYSFAHNAVAISCNLSNATITHNLFINNISIGCIGLFSGRGTIINNTFDYNSRGFWSLSGFGIAKNNIITHCTDYAVANEFEELDYNCLMYNYPNYYQTTGGPNSITVNPLYCDAPLEDYFLGSASGCIGAGEGGVDMGAYGVGCDEPVPKRPDVTAITVGWPDDSLHVVDQTPDIAWGYFDDLNRPLSGSEVEVGTDDEWTTAELWQTGFMASTDTSVTYAGLPLADGATYWVRTRVFNDQQASFWASTSFRMNTAPTEPLLLEPADQSILPSNCVELVIENSTDAEDDPVTYDFELYSDPGLTVFYGADTLVAEQTGGTTLVLFLGLSAQTEYWWRARARDGWEPSSWTAAQSFTTSDLSPAIRVPADFATIQDAVDAALCTGDTILVAAGTYSENIDLGGHRVRIISEDGPDHTVLTPADPGVPTITIANGEDAFAEIRGFTLQGGEGLSVIDIRNGSAPILQDNVFRDQSSYVANAVYIACHASDPLITYNVFHDNISLGCVGVFSGSARIINNTFDRNSRGYWTQSGQGVAKNNIITNSVDFGVWGYFTELDYNCVWNNNPDYTWGAVPGEHAVAAYPFYCDQYNHDYSLTTTSPCVGAGEGGLTIGARDATCDGSDLNRVVVASKTVAPGAEDVVIPIYIQNTVALRSIKVPLVIRSIIPGSYITSLGMSYGDRLLPGGALDDVSLKQSYPYPDGLCGEGGFGNLAPVDYVSPDGLLFQRTKIFSEPLAVGADVSGSMMLTVGVTDAWGAFEIDTTCTDPDNHLLFVSDVTGLGSTPSFTKGIISISGAVGPAHAAVEWTTIPFGESATIGVFLSNDVDVTALTVPLVIRSTTLGVYPQSVTGYYPSGSRLSGTLTDQIGISGYDRRDGICDVSGVRGFQTVEGAVSGGEDVTYTMATPDSPDALMFTRSRIGSPMLAPGSDGATPSIALDVVAPLEAGFFTIDTACVDPSNHLVFLDTEGQPVAGATFTAGVIEVIPACYCPHQADANADGFATSLDLTELIDELWAGHALLQDQACPAVRADFDCDGFLTALDLTFMIDYLFAGGSGPCDPCQCAAYPTDCP